MFERLFEYDEYSIQQLLWFIIDAMVENDIFGY